MSFVEKLLFLVCNKLFGSSFEQFLTYSIFLEIGVSILVLILFIIIYFKFFKK